MKSNITLIEIFTVLSAVIAAIASVYNVRATKKSNEKKDLLNNYTSERLYDLHEMKKWANILLNEAAVAIHCTRKGQDVEARISRVIEAGNQYWFILKPVYLRDEEVLRAMLDLKKEIIDYYKESQKSKREEHIPALKEKGMRFRKLAFIYAHSSWTCIKNQIVKGECSQYDEFNLVYTDKESCIEDILNEKHEYGDLWEL